MSLLINAKKKNCYYIILQCKSMECGWKYCFHTSKKQGRSPEIEVRAVLAFREIGRDHNTIYTVQSAKL